MRRFIAIFLVFTLFFNMNTVALADGNIIEAIEGTNPNASLTTLPTVSDGSGSTELSNSPEATADGSLGWIVDIINGLIGFVFTPITWLVESMPSFEEYVFGRKLSNLKSPEASDSPFQLSFFTAEPSGVAGSIQSITASVYNALRYLVTAFYIIILVYLAVRILLSSVGRQKAHYKALLQYWVVGLLLLFSFHWVMAFIIWLSDIFTGIFASIGYSAFESGGLTAEHSLTYFLSETLPETSQTLKVVFVGPILQVFIAIAAIVATLLVGFIYLKRLLFVALLIIVFPLVVLSYVFDKIGDRKSQTFNTWLKEFVTNVCVQPIHALLLSFMLILISEGSSKGGIFHIQVIGPILALVLIYLLPSGEKFLKQLFQISSSMGVGGGIAHALAHQGMALQHMRNLTRPFTDLVAKRHAAKQILKETGVIPTLRERFGFNGWKGVGGTVKGAVKNTAGLVKDAIPGMKTHALHNFKKTNSDAYRKVQEQLKKATGSSSYLGGRFAAMANTAGAFVGAAAGTGFAVMGEGATGAVVASGIARATNKVSSFAVNYATAGGAYSDMAKKLEAEGLDNLLPSDKQFLANMYGGEGNIPKDVKTIQQDLLFKRRVSHIGDSNNPSILPSQRQAREAVFGEDGILQKNNGKSAVFSKDKATFTDKNGKEYTIIGEGISGLKHNIEIPLDGVTADNRDALIEKNLDKAMEKAGYTAAAGYKPEQLEKIRGSMRSGVIKDFDKATEYLESVTHQPPLITAASTQSVNTTSKFNTIDNVIAARANPGEYSVSADAMNTINNKAVATINQEVHKAHFDAIKSNPHVSAAQFSQILADNNIREVTDEHGVTTGYAINDSSKRANYSGAMQQFHALDSSIPASAHADYGVQEIKSINDLSGIAPADFGLSEATYSNVTRQIVADAKSFEAQQKLREIDSNPAAYGISRSAMNEVLEANGISRLNGDLSSDRSLAKATSALEGLEELQAKNPYVATVQQACSDIGTGSVRTERATAYLTQPQLQALQSQGPLQMTYSGKNVTITPINNPDAAITVPSGMELPEGETVIKAGVVDPLDGNQILQTFANVEYFRAQQPSVTLPDEGTPYEMDMIDLSKLPSEQFNMIRSGDYCIVTDTNGNILYSQRGLSVIPDSHMVSLSPRDTGSGTEYIINSTSPINKDMMTKLKEKGSLLRARSLASDSEEQKREANTTQNLITELAKKLGFGK